MNRKYGCAILAGGAGSRMGNVNTANLEYMGRAVRCIPAMEDDITAGKYKIRMTIDKLNCRIVNTDDAGIDSKAFSNINRPEDYRDILADYQKRHILICAKRQVGKTTLIEKVIQDIKIPIYGY